MVEREKKWDEKLGDLEKSWIKARNAKLVQLERELAGHHRMREGLAKNPSAVKFLQNSAAEAMLREGASEVEAAAAACKQLRELKPRAPASASPTVMCLVAWVFAGHANRQPSRTATRCSAEEPGS